MKKFTLLVLTVIVYSMSNYLFAQEPEATSGYTFGTLDKLLFSVFASKVDLGGDAKEFEKYLDDIYTLGASVAVPFSPYFSVIGNVARTNISGNFNEDGLSLDGDITVVALSGGARVHLLPHQRVNPFVFGSYTYASTEYDFTVDRETSSDSDSETSLSYGLGVEFSFTERLTLLGSVTRTSPQGNDDRGVNWSAEGLDDPNEDRDSVALALNYWVNPQILISLLYGYELEDETVSYGLGLGVSF